MLPSMIGGYQLGSDTEQIYFEAEGVAYRRAGATHAVDPNDPANTHAVKMSYALCGTPVRSWPDERFDPTAREAHEQCVALAGATTTTGAPPSAR